MAQQVVETVATKAALTATYGGSAGAVYFGLTANEIAAFGGLAVAVIGLLVTWYYKHKHYKLAEKKILLEEDDE